MTKGFVAYRSLLVLPLLLLVSVPFKLSFVLVDIAEDAAAFIAECFI